MDAADEVGEHGLGDFEVGDDAVAQGADGGDGAGGFAEHFLGGLADGITVLEDARGAFFDGDDGGFIEDDAFTADVNKGICRAQVDGHIIGK